MSNIEIKLIGLGLSKLIKINYLYLDLSFNNTFYYE